MSFFRQVIKQEGGRGSNLLNLSFLILSPLTSCIMKQMSLPVHNPYLLTNVGKLELLWKSHQTAKIWQHLHPIQTVTASLLSPLLSMTRIKTQAAQHLMLATWSNWNCMWPNSNTAIVQVWEMHQFSLCSPSPPPEWNKTPIQQQAGLSEWMAIKQPEIHTGHSMPLSWV